MASRRSQTIAIALVWSAETRQKCGKHAAALRSSFQTLYSEDAEETLKRRWRDVEEDA